MGETDKIEWEESIYCVEEDVHWRNMHVYSYNKIYRGSKLNGVGKCDCKNLINY